MLRSAAMLAIAGLVAAPLHAQSDQFRWRGIVASGKTIEVAGVNGSIQASGTTGREVEVTAVKRLEARTVNGEIVARGLDAETEAYTVNGSIAVETRSWATASTVNGSITARMGRTDWSGENGFETVNGGITLDLPAGTSLQVDASTVNGSMSTDFPLTIRGKWGPRRMSGTIGEGGRILSLSTVNGSLELRRAP